MVLVDGVFLGYLKGLIYVVIFCFFNFLCVFIVLLVKVFEYEDIVRLGLVDRKVFLDGYFLVSILIEL